MDPHVQSMHIPRFPPFGEGDHIGGRAKPTPARVDGCTWDAPLLVRNSSQCRSQSEQSNRILDDPTYAASCGQVALIRQMYVTNCPHFNGAQ